MAIYGTSNAERQKIVKWNIQFTVKSGPKAIKVKKREREYIYK
jgi:hypothetical protein